MEENLRLEKQKEANGRRWKNGGLLERDESMVRKPMKKNKQS